MTFVKPHKALQFFLISYPQAVYISNGFIWHFENIFVLRL